MMECGAQCAALDGAMLMQKLSAGNWDIPQQVQFNKENLSEMSKCQTDAVPRYNATFGQGVVPVLLHNVACSGLENKLLDCVSDVNRRTDVCLHTQDAGVTCRLGT